MVAALTPDGFPAAVVRHGLHAYCNVAGEGEGGGCYILTVCSCKKLSPGVELIFRLSAVHFVLLQRRRPGRGWGCHPLIVCSCVKLSLSSDVEFIFRLRVLSFRFVAYSQEDLSHRVPTHMYLDAVV